MSFKNALVSVLAFVTITGCSESSTMLVPKGIPPEGYTEKPSGLQNFNPKVDILFVIDSSYSMDEAQDNLKLNAYKFADALAKSPILDYHVGVLTTDMSSCRTNCGKLQGVPAFLHKNTPNLVSVLSSRLVVGTGGSAEEMMFSPVIEALSPALETRENKGFYRQDAYLAVIIITDAKEQSKYSPEEMHDFLVQKKGDARRVLGYGVIRKLADTGCTSGNEPLDGKLEDFLMLVENGNARQENVLSLCTENYGEKLAEFANDIVSRSAGTVKLSRLPKENTIRVTYGTQIIPNNLYKGWTFRSSSNTLEFGKDIEWSVQPDGTSVTIDFEVLDTRGN